MREKRFTVFLTSFILLCLAFFPAGCWDRREPDLLGIVTIAAFDIDEQSGLFRVYAQVNNPVGGGQQQSSGGDGSQGSSSAWVVETTGHTIYEAVINIELISSRRLFWSHVKAVLFSEKLAREGIRPILDFLDRERQVRLIAQPFVVQGDLRRLLEANFPMEVEGGEAMSKQSFSIMQESSFLSEVESLLILFRNISIPGIEINMPRLTVLANEGENEEKPSGKPNPVKISGIGIFRGDKLVGFFDEKETAGYNWLTGNIQRHNLILQCPGSEDDYMTVQVFDSSVKLTPEIKDDEVRFKASVSAEGRLQDFTCPQFPLEREFIDSLNRRMATAIRNEITSSLEKARELESDIFGLGNIIYRTRNEDWKRLGDNWREIFPGIMVDIEVEAKILRHGLILEPLQIQ
ncbi:MAG: Ger(x)C family spore germination protein [Firmicutes bacterium]|nr:Ger(x)C family spore germination protein [Bacillota bacterium]